MFKIPDNYSIKSASKLKSESPLDSDNMKIKYYEKNNETNFIVNYVGAAYPTLEKNLFTLLRVSSKHAFKSTWKQRPDYASYDLYKTEIYWYILMYVNGVFCIEDFKDLDYILAPSYIALLDIVKDRAPKDFIENSFNNVKTFNINSDGKLYDPNNVIRPYKKYNIADMNKVRDLINESITVEDTSLEEVTEETTCLNSLHRYIITSVTLNLGYFDLKELPGADQRIEVYVDNYNIPLIPEMDYSIDYNRSKFFIRNVEDVLQNGSVIRVFFICLTSGETIDPDDYIDDDTEDDTDCCDGIDEDGDGDVDVDIEPFNCEKII